MLSARPAKPTAACLFHAVTQGKVCTARRPARRESPQVSSASHEALKDEQSLELLLRSPVSLAVCTGTVQATRARVCSVMRLPTQDKPTAYLAMRRVTLDEVSSDALRACPAQHTASEARHSQQQGQVSLAKLPPHQARTLVYLASQQARQAMVFTANQQRHPGRQSACLVRHPAHRALESLGAQPA